MLYAGLVMALGLDRFRLAVFIDFRTTYYGLNRSCRLAVCVAWQGSIYGGGRRWHDRADLTAKEGVVVIVGW